MPVLSPVLNDNNSIGYSLGIQFKLRQVFKDGRKADVTLTKAKEDNVFYGLFDAEDIDFEIVIDNKSGQRNIRFALKVPNDEFQGYIIKKGLWSTIKALEVKGKHLHFVSQTTEVGKSIVGTCAYMNMVSYKEAALNCSRIDFSLSVEENTTEDNIPPPPDYNAPKKVARCGKAPAVGAGNQGNNKKLGERGIVCFGKETDQHFGTAVWFKVSKEFELKPFTFELRMKSKYFDQN